MLGLADRDSFESEVKVCHQQEAQKVVYAAAFGSVFEHQSIAPKYACRKS